MPRKKPISEREAVSEIFMFFSVLFDGPPPASITPRLLNDIFHDLRNTVGLTAPREPIDPSALVEEYEPLFLIPDAINPLSLYSTHYHADGESAGDDFTTELTLLAAALKMPWKKQEFVPGRAYPITPDHLSVEFGLLSALVQANPTTDIVGKPALAWMYQLSQKITHTLEQLQHILQGLALPRRPPAYEEVVTLALAYMKAYARLEFSAPQ